MFGNPIFGAAFALALAEDIKRLKQQRQEDESTVIDVEARVVEDVPALPGAQSIVQHKEAV